MCVYIYANVYIYTYIYTIKYKKNILLVCLLSLYYEFPGVYMCLGDPWDVPALSS